MEMRYVSDEQLLEIYKLVKLEIRRRGNEKSDARSLFQNKLRTFADIFPDDFLDATHAKSARLKGKPGSPLALRQVDMMTPVEYRLKYLPLLLSQDWSYLFTGGESTRKFYVYLHVDPGKNHLKLPKHLGGHLVPRPIYVGKGTGNRAFDMKRNQGHGKKIKHLFGQGHTDKDIAFIFRRNLSEDAAFELEAKLIYFFGTIYEPDRLGCLYNLDIPSLPQFSAEMDKVESKSERSKAA